MVKLQLHQLSHMFFYFIPILRGQKCSTCETRVEHMPTSMMRTLGHMHREHDLHWPKCEFNGKKCFPPHLVVCKAF